MKLPELFEYTKYKVFLKSLVNLNSDIRGFQTTLCNQIRCQPATLSRVLNNKSELTRDQVANICEATRMNELESEYFLALYDTELSSSPYLRRNAERKLDELKLNSQKIAAQIEDHSEILDQEYVGLYYSSWHYPAIHILLMIAKFQNLEALSLRLGLTPVALLRYIQTLIQWGLVKNNGSRYIATEKQIHLDKSSPYSNADHLNWRLKALEDLHQKKDESLHYSSIFSISENDFIELKKTLLKDLKKYRAKIIPSPSEDAFVFNFDLFRL